MSMADFAVTENGQTTYYDANGNPWSGTPASQSSQPAPQQAYNPPPPATLAPAYQLPADTGKSGVDEMRAQLEPYGLSELAQRAWDFSIQSDPSDAEFRLWLRQQPEYKTRFPAMDRLAQNGHAISEGEYVGLERDFKQRFRAAGLPEGFYDTPSDFTSFIANEVSPAELQSRLDEYTNITFQLPPIVRDELGRQYGLTPGDITAYIIDPTRALPILHKQVLAAQTGAGARQAGYGNLLNSEAEQLAGLGVDFNAAIKGFGELVHNKQLFQHLGTDAGETQITRDQQLGAEFGGDAAAQQVIADRARRRVAAFQGGGSYGAGFGTATVA